MRKKDRPREIPSRRSKAIRILIPLIVLIVINLFTGITNVLPSQARQDVEWDQGMTSPQVIWEHWEWGLSRKQKKSYLSVTSQMLCFSNVGLHGLRSFLGNAFSGGGWQSNEPLVLRQQAGYPAQCGIYELEDGNTHVVYLVGRVADYRVEKVAFEIRWGFDVEQVELTEQDYIRNEDGVFFVYRMDASDRVSGSASSRLAGVFMTVFKEDGEKLSWTDEDGYVTDRYYVEERIRAES